MGDGRPTWAWCIATYKRHDMLERSCALALEQTVPPSELVVTDASPNWDEGRARLEKVLASYAATGRAAPRLDYAEASVASSSKQRNESIERCTADVLFLFDDDTLMFPETAERLLEVYARDADGVVQAVTAKHVPRPPPPPPWLSGDSASPAEGEPEEQDDEISEAPTLRRSPLARAARQLLRADDRFVTYDDPAPEHSLPRGLEGMGLSVWKLAAGFHLTCRRQSALREPFEGRLRGYCAGEDSDMTYRLTRHGPILHRPDAPIHHAEAPGARFGMYRRTALGAINALLLHRVHSTDIARSKRENRALLGRRLLIESAKDLRSGDLTMPRARGIAFALRNLQEILECPQASLDAMFERHQS